MSFIRHALPRVSAASYSSVGMSIVAHVEGSVGSIARDTHQRKRKRRLERAAASARIHRSRQKRCPGHKQTALERTPGSNHKNFTRLAQENCSNPVRSDQGLRAKNRRRESSVGGRGA